MPTVTTGIATLHLETWQQRMIKDFAGIKFERTPKVLTLKFHPGGCLSSYKVPPEGIHIGDWLMYLTDSQMEHLKDDLGLHTSIPTINVTRAAMEKGEITFK